MVKNKFFSALLSLSFLLVVTQLPAKELMYYVDVCSFHDQEGKPYLELYLDVEVSSMVLEQSGPGAFSGEVDVRIEVINGVGDVVYDRHMALISPAVSDSSSNEKNFGVMDVRRISLDPGKYTLNGYLKDNKKEGAKQHMFVREFEISAQPSGFASMSDVEFIQSFSKTTTQQAHSKHGYDILPLVTNASFVDADKVKYYAEAYHTDRESEEVFFVNSYITIANSEAKLSGMQKISRQNVAPLSIIQGEFDISDLPSQSYYLHIDLFNKKQEPIANVVRKFFVSNSRVETPVAATGVPFEEVFSLTEEDLNYYIHTLYLISTTTEIEFARSLQTLEEKQNYFMNFWSKRKRRPGDSPEKPFLAHKNRVEYANDHFKAAHLEGWRTDRGRILLSHGPANDIERFPNSTANYPYVIWRYNQIKTQSNVVFIFYNPNLAIDEYVMLHSNMIGELNNPRWQYEVARTAQDVNLDNNTLFEDFGTNRINR